jgi:hypothetical protein
MKVVRKRAVECLGDGEMFLGVYWETLWWNAAQMHQARGIPMRIRREYWLGNQSELFLTITPSKDLGQRRLGLGGSRFEQKRTGEGLGGFQCHSPRGLVTHLWNHPNKPSHLGIAEG